MYSKPFGATASIGVLAGFGCVPVPFPLPMRIFLPSGLTPTADGYQPVGMKPATRLFPQREMSITQTSLLSALATYRVRLSGEIASASGVLPDGACGVRVVLTVSRGACALRS